MLIAGLKFFPNDLKLPTMTDTIKTERKKRTPRDAESILKGLLNLPLAERVKIKNSLAESIETELKDKETELAQAKEIANGKQY